MIVYPNWSNNNNDHTMGTDSSSINLTASITKHEDHAATFIDNDSVKGCIKQKYLKSGLINLMQSYLYAVIKQEKNDWCYQSRYKLKLGKIIQSLRAADNKASIVKYAERIVKNKEDFVSLPEDSLINITQLPTTLTKTHKIIHRGRPKSTREPIYTNICILHTADIQDIIGDLKYDLEVEGINLGLQRLQHHDVVTIGYICSMMAKIDTREWTKILKNTLKNCLYCEPELSLKSSKIYNADSNAKKKPSQFRILSRPLPKRWAST